MSRAPHDQTRKQILGYLINLFYVSNGSRLNMWSYSHQRFASVMGDIHNYNLQRVNDDDYLCQCYELNPF